MKRKKLISITAAVALLFAVLIICASCAGRVNARAASDRSAASTEATRAAAPDNADSPSNPAVYFTTDISPAGLMAVYQACLLANPGLEVSGNVAIKVHTGEPGNTHFVKPEFMRELVQRVNGTFIEANTAYGGRRASSQAHYQVARDHGFTAVAPVVILDEKTDISIPVVEGSHLKENITGERFKDFDFHIVISHFKGHQMGGYGGALKNLSIGYASSAGKNMIHSGGKSRTSMRGDQNTFLESMAEAAKSIVDSVDGKILFINVMNHLSVDCDCNGRPSAPTMADIGILASIDPVALDQACIDLVYAAPDSKDLINRVESRNGLLTIEHAAKLGIGSKTYNLVKL